METTVCLNLQQIWFANFSIISQHRVTFCKQVLLLKKTIFEEPKYTHGDGLTKE